MDDDTRGGTAWARETWLWRSRQRKVPWPRRLLARLTSRPRTLAVGFAAAVLAITFTTLPEPLGRDATLASLATPVQVPANATETKTTPTTIPVVQVAAAAHTGLVYPYFGEGIAHMVGRTCGSQATWQANAAANGVRGPVWRIFYRQGYRIDCGLKPTAVVVPATTKVPAATPPRTGTGWAHPLPGHCGSRSSFGAPRDGGRRSHQGIDFGASTGTPIHAAAAGVVFVAGWVSANAGYGVELRTPSGVVTKYFHIRSGGVAVHNGQQVTAGQVIGYVGATGDATGSHLHFELWDNGSLRNPGNYLAARGVNVYC